MKKSKKILSIKKKVLKKSRSKLLFDGDYFIEIVSKKVKDNADCFVSYGLF